MRRGMWPAACAVLAVGWCACAGAGAPGQPGSERAIPVPWVPSESWPGGRQYDPRLDRPVEFWGAGMPLRDVFAGVKEQTGVEVGFWPPGDVNERVCITLYLNPEEPPTLRELMVQLSWVMDCGFGISGEEEEERSYCLLATSIKGGALRRMEEEQAANVREWRASGRESFLEAAQEVTEKLPELRRARELSQDELIARYRGVDDLVLLAMLDPGRRAVIEFVLDLPEEDYERFLRGRLVTREWDELTSLQKSGVRSIIVHNSQEVLAVDWSSDVPIRVTLHPPLAVGFSVVIESSGPPGTAAAGGVSCIAHVRVTDVGTRWSAEDEIALRELLGEAVGLEERGAIIEKWDQELAARRERRRAASVRQELERRMVSQRPLSPAAEALLSSFALPEAFDDGCSLWQIQEAVASASRMHVVSDCFWQPRRDLREVIELLHPEGQPEMTALLALRLSCLATVAPERLFYWHANNDRAGWEWEDSGRFLRFRHLARDLWRAAFLPEAVLERIDAWLGPYAESAEGRGTAVEVEVDLEDACKLVAALDGWQLRHGGKINYGDPMEERDRRLQAVREKVLAEIAREESTFRFLATLSAEQWELLRGPGLRWREHLSPDQQEMELSHYFAPFHEALAEALLRLEEAGAASDREDRQGAPETYMLRVTLPTGPPPHGPREYTSLKTGELAAIHRIFLPRKVRVAFPQPEVGEQQPGTASEIEQGDAQPVSSGSEHVRSVDPDRKQQR